MKNVDLKNTKHYKILLVLNSDILTSSFTADRCQRTVHGIPCVLPFKKNSQVYHKCERFNTGRNPLCKLYGDGIQHHHQGGEYSAEGYCEDDCDLKGKYFTMQLIYSPNT